MCQMGTDQLIRNKKFPGSKWESFVILVSAMIRGKSFFECERLGPSFHTWPLEFEKASFVEPNGEGSEECRRFL